MRAWRRAAAGGAMVLAAAACVRPGQQGSTSNGVFTSEGLASVTSFQCSQQEVSGLGYRVSWYDGGSESLRAERRSDNGAQPWVGYLTVSVTRESGGEFLVVNAERYEQGSRLPIPANPSPQPTPVPPIPMPRPQSQRTPRRVTPGPVAEDARRVVSRCALGGVRNSSVRSGME